MRTALWMMAALVLVARAGAMEPGPADGAAATPATPAPASQPAQPATPAQASSTMEPAVQTTPTPSAAGRRAQDRLELDTTQITGNRELPRVLYVVPWKRADLGDLGGKPVNSLLDEVLAPVDRDVFRRQNRYYQALKPDSNGGAGAGGTEGEK